MNELPRFYIDEHTPTDSPFRKASDAWEEVDSEYVRNWQGILGVINDASRDSVIESVTPGQTYEERASFAGIRIEETLSEEYPEFSIAVNQLRLALNGIIQLRRPLTWNHYVRGEIVDWSVAGLDEIEDDAIVRLSPKRARAQFPEDSGYLQAHQIGYGTHMSSVMGGFHGYPMWLQISPEQDDRRVIMYSLYEMFAIRQGKYEE